MAWRPLVTALVLGVHWGCAWTGPVGPEPGRGAPVCYVYAISGLRGPDETAYSGVRYALWEDGTIAFMREEGNDPTRMVYVGAVHPALVKATRERIRESPLLDYSGRVYAVPCGGSVDVVVWTDRRTRTVITWDEWTPPTSPAFKQAWKGMHGLLEMLSQEAMNVREAPPEVHDAIDRLRFARR